jgi:hypothetical protein
MNDSISSETKAWLIAAVTKLTPQAHSSNIVERLIQEFTVSLNTCMRQHAFELKHLHENVEAMKSLFPVDKSCEDMVVRHLCSIFLKLCCCLSIECIMHLWCVRNIWNYSFYSIYTEGCSFSHISGRENLRAFILYWSNSQKQRSIFSGKQQ